MALFRRVADPRRQLAGRADDHHVAHRHGRRLVDDPAGGDLGAAHAVRVADRTRLLVAARDVEVLDQRLPVGRPRVDDAALLAAVLAGEHLHEVAFLHLHLRRHLEHLRSQAHDLHEVLLAQLAGHGPEDARAARVALVVDDHRCVLVERDQRSVVAAERLPRTDDDRLHDLALLDGALRRRRLHGSGDDVADARVAAAGAPGDADAEQPARAGVVRNLQTCLLLDHQSLPRLLHDLREAPVLRLRERARLDDPDDVADARGVLLVVRVELARAADDLLVLRVQLGDVDLDDDRLLTLVGDDDAAALLARGRRGLRLRGTRDPLAPGRLLARRLRMLVALGPRQPLLRPLRSLRFGHRLLLLGR